MCAVPKPSDKFIRRCLAEPNPKPTRALIGVALCRQESVEMFSTTKAIERKICERRRATEVEALSVTDSTEKQRTCVSVTHRRTITARDTKNVLHTLTSRDQLWTRHEPHQHYRLRLQARAINRLSDSPGWLSAPTPLYLEKTLPRQIGYCHPGHPISS